MGDEFCQMPFLNLFRWPYISPFFSSVNEVNNIN
jgi:hypothetical protein